MKLSNTFMDFEKSKLNSIFFFKRFGTTLVPAQIFSDLLKNN